MEKKQIDEMLKAQQYEELRDILEEEDYEEYAMLSLCKVYLHLEEAKKAKKVLRKMKMLFPAGKYLQEAELLNEAIENGTTQAVFKLEEKPETRIEVERVSGAEIKQEVVKEMKQEGKQEVASESLTEFLSRGKKKKKERIIPENIKECFADVIGLDTVQADLDKFYKLLRFQNERKQNSFKGELLEFTHFIIAGAPGCGKTMVGEIIGELLYDFEIRKENRVEYIEGKAIFDAFNNHDEKGMENLFLAYKNITVVIENIDVAVLPYEDNFVTRFTVALKKFLSNRKHDLSVIITGSEDAVKKMVNLCPTVEDALYGVLHIPAYSSIELLEITKQLAEEKALRIHKDAEAALLKKIDMEKSRMDFMNAITLSRYIDQAALKMAERYFSNSSNSEATMVYIMPEDFEIEMEDESIEELLNQLDALTGLHAVKTQVRKRIESVTIAAEAEKEGVAVKGGQGTLHMLFTGNPGTGKTTVARIIGKIYQQLGILPRGNCLVECTRSDLVAEYVGQTAPKVRAKVKEAMGGVLFIDEAYSVCRDEFDSFGHEAVDELIKQIEDNKENLLVILAGYKKEMAEFMKSNPGFTSRIRNTIEFEDYTTEEMVEIYKGMVKGVGMKLESDMDDVVMQMIDTMSKEPDFGNARGVRNLFEDTKEVLNGRIFQMKSKGENVSNEEYITIRKSDLETLMGKQAAERKSIAQLLDELNGLTGLTGVKAKVQEMVDDMEVKAYLKNQSMGAESGHGTLHLVFKGNAGTGKTTVARIIGQIYKELGVLQKNVFVEVGRSDLVASYSGQTAKKVKEKVEEAEGGILFIDEAYTLNQGEDDSFGHEAINTLVAELENRRDKLMVILAGYEDEMKQFLEVNQGLASRLANEIVFDDYTDKELLQIFKYQAKKKGLFTSDDLNEVILEKIRIEKSKVKDFGNARGVRNIVESIEKQKNSRLAPLLRAGETLSEEVLCKVEAEDFGIEQELMESSQSVEQLLEELHGLTGLAAVKAKVQEMIDDIQFKELLKSQDVEVAEGHGTLHLVFKGNAGTGKTTVARIIGKLYKKLGILERDTFIEVGRSDLVGEYLGHTAKKVRKKVEEAEGGILFIDEAYTLNQGERDEFGREAINTLVAELENRRDKLMVILAGYGTEMDAFLKVNQGLASRLANEIIFEDYTEEELLQIFKYQAEKRGMILPEELESSVIEKIKEEREKVADFGNARGVRNMVETAEKKKSTRIMKCVKEGQKLSEEFLKTLAEEDFN